MRRDALGLTHDELAFYDALDTNDSAVAVLGDTVLTQIARELTETIRSFMTLDWTLKETVRTRLRTLVRRKLRQWGYPPDKTELAVDTLLKQAELLAANWVGCARNDVREASPLAQTFIHFDPSIKNMDTLG